jgi:agmatinase
LAKQRGIRFHPMLEILERGIDDVMDETIARVWDGTDGQYLSFNFNVMDSSAAPGVTATEPGGLESREIMRVASKIAARGGPSVIDVTELCPMFDVSGSTSRMAVCVALRIMAGVAVKNGQTVDESIRRPNWQHGS